MSVSSSQAKAVVETAFQARTFDTLEIDVPGAHVQLRPHDEGNHVYLRGAVPDADLESAQEVFDRRGVSTHQSGERLHIFGNRLSRDVNVEDWRWRHQDHRTVLLDIRLPPNLDVTTHAPGGTLDAAGLTGTLDASVRGGTAQLVQMEGPLQVRGSGAPLTVREYAGPSLNLQWRTGPVTLEQIGPGSTILHTASAPTTLHDLDGPADLSVHGASLTLRNVTGPCEASVQGGSLSFHGAPPHDTSLRAVGGPLHAHLPPTHAASIRLSGAHAVLDDAFAFEGKRTGKRIEGTLNGGGPNLILQAVQGSARCSVQKEARS